MTAHALPTGPKLLQDERFIWDHVWPHFARRGDRPASQARFELKVHGSSQGRRHAVAEYAFDESRRVVAKMFTDTKEGRNVHQILRTLWEHGFGAPAPFRVPEPIAYLPERGVLLMGRARGQVLGGLEKLDERAFKDGARRTARWLVALHVSELRVGPEEDRLRDAFRMSRRLAEAIRCRPDLEDVLRRAAEELASRAAQAIEPKTVQTHRRYEATRVFLAPDHVTVIGLDRAAVGDPMRDVGEFVHRLRWDGAKEGLDDNAVRNATNLFLSEYVRDGSPDVSSMIYQWSYSVMWTLLGLACTRRAGGRDWEDHSGFLQDQFRHIPLIAGEWRDRDGPRSAG